MPATKLKKGAVITGYYPQKTSLRDYIQIYGLKVSDVKKAAKEIGIKPCLNGRH